MITPLLKNDRITLRAMEPEDLEFIYRMENDTTLWSAGSTNVPYSRYKIGRAHV